MRRKLLLPAITLCMGSSLLVSPIRADDKTYERTTVTTVKTDAPLDFKEHMSAGQLLHSTVLDRSDQKIGELEDIVLDPNSGRIQFGLLKLSGDLADNGKYTPVPFSLLTVKDMSAKADVFGHRDLVLQTDREKLLSASKFSIKSWPNRDRVIVWGPDVYSHYGVTLDRDVSRGATGATIDSDTGTGSSTVTIREREPRTYRYEYRYYETDEDKPIDNGTGPDGKDTFHFTPRPWPYNQFPEGQRR